MKITRLSIALAFLLISLQGFAEASVNEKPFLGTWKLMAMTEQQTTNASPVIDSVYGNHPKGYLFYMPDGHMSVLITAENRAPFNSDHLLKTITSYAGTYHVQGNEIIHHIDVAWKPAWEGVEQKRTYKFSGNQLTLCAPPDQSNNKDKVIYCLVWQRIY